MAKALTWLLRVSGILLLTALFPAVMPFAWMDLIHRHLGMGTLPDEPIVEYLTRSASLLYAFHGALVLAVSRDVRRFLPLVTFLGASGIVFGFGMLVLDVWVGLPLPWILGEGPMIVLLGATLLWLARRVGRLERDGKPT